MITQAKLADLVEEYSTQQEIYGFVCVGHGINFQYRGMDIPFSLTDFLGIKFHELYKPSKDIDENTGDPIMEAGAYGAIPEDLYYIKSSKYDWLMDTLID